MAKKAKWLEQASEFELLNMLSEVLNSDEIDDKKAQKIVAELIERTPEDSEELGVEEALVGLEQAMATGIALVQKAYKTELEAVDGVEDTDDEDVEEDEVEEEEEVKPSKKSKKGKKEKKAKKDKKSKKVKKEVEEVEEVEEDEDEAEGYEAMSQKALKNLCRERGLKVNKSMKKADFIKALEADDEE